MERNSIKKKDGKNNEILIYYYIINILKYTLKVYFISSER